MANFQNDIETKCLTLIMECASLAKQIGSDCYPIFRDALIGFNQSGALPEELAKKKCDIIDAMLKARLMLWADLEIWIYMHKDVGGEPKAPKSVSKTRKSLKK